VIARDPTAAPSPAFTDKTVIRQRSRQDLEKGAVTAAYKANREKVVALLNDALATEIVCVLRYRRHALMARGIASASVAEEFLEHSREEQEHADKIAERIVQLDGEPNLSPAGMLDRAHSQYVEGTSLVDMVRENLVAERIAIESYAEIIRFVGQDDPTTRRLMEEILAKEEEHAEEMSDLLEPPPAKKP
jgi:bacterioferritin